MEAVEDVVIVGAGIAGLATALGLQRNGVRGVVLESSEHLRASGYALNIWSNAWKALDALGVGDSLRQNHLRLEAYNLVICSSSSVSTTFRDSLRLRGKSEEHEVRCLKRNVLVETLAEELSHGTIRYSSKVVSIEEKGSLKILHLVDGSTIQAKVVIGCDGVNSVVAKLLGFEKPRFSGRLSSRGVAEFPEGHGFAPEFLQYVGEGFRAGFVPCDNTSVYWFFTWIPSPRDDNVHWNAINMKEFVINKMKISNVPERILQVIEKSVISGAVFSPLLYRFPIELLGANISRNYISVAGDAIHPMTPDIGQGACSALEDGVILSRCLAEAICKNGGGSKREGSNSMKEGMEKYAQERRCRWVKLIATAYVVGFIQQTSDPTISFLREKFLGRFIARIILGKADFNCGML